MCTGLNSWVSSGGHCLCFHVIMMPSRQINHFSSGVVIYTSVLTNSFLLMSQHPSFASNYSTNGKKHCKIKLGLPDVNFLFLFYVKISLEVIKSRKPKNTGIRSSLTAKHTSWMSSSISFSYLPVCGNWIRSRKATDKISVFWPLS